MEVSHRITVREWSVRERVREPTIADKSIYPGHPPKERDREKVKEKTSRVRKEEDLAAPVQLVRTALEEGMLT